MKQSAGGKPDVSGCSLKKQRKEKKITQNGKAKKGGKRPLRKKLKEKKKKESHAPSHTGFRKRTTVPR